MWKLTPGWLIYHVANANAVFYNSCLIITIVQSERLAFAGNVTALRTMRYTHVALLGESGGGGGETHAIRNRRGGENL